MYRSQIKVSSDGNFYTLVPDRADIAHDGSGTGSCICRLGIEQVLSIFQIAVDYQCKFVIEEAEVDTDVSLTGFFPGEFRVSEYGRVNTAMSHIVLATSHLRL